MRPSIFVQGSSREDSKHVEHNAGALPIHPASGPILFLAPSSKFEITSLGRADDGAAELVGSPVFFLFAFAFWAPKTDFEPVGIPR